MSDNFAPRIWKRLDGPLFVEQSGGQSTSNRILLHGFTQTGQSWNPYIDLLSSQQLITRVDAPGHARSSEVATNLVQTSHQLVAQCGYGDYVGYSMGARLALHVACNHLSSVRRLVLISGTPGLRTQHERDLRVESDEQLAQHVLDIGVETFIPEWLSHPMFAGLSTSKIELSDRLRNTAEGLAMSLRINGTGSQDSLWGRIAAIQIPVLLIVGENDQKFVDIAFRMKEVMGPHVELKIFNNTGHPVHLEQPIECAAEIESFLTR